MQVLRYYIMKLRERERVTELNRCMLRKNCHRIENEWMAMGIRDEREERLNPHSEN